MSGPGRIGRRRSALPPSRRRTRPASPKASLQISGLIIATARQLMSPAPSGVDEFDSLVVAAQRMRSQGVGTIPVRGLGNRFVGMLTDRDIIERCVADARDPGGVPACSLVARLCPVIAADQLVDPSLLTMLLSHPMAQIPVLQDDQLVGMLTISDVAGHFIDDNPPA